MRRLLLEGMGSAKRQLLPQGVLSFVAGLGEQQLPLTLTLTPNPNPNPNLQE